MKYEVAFACAQGYAWGREDSSAGVKTAVQGDRVGCYAFATAFATGYDLYNRELLFHMVSVQRAYQAWQESGGKTIWDDQNERERAEQAAERLKTECVT